MARWAESVPADIVVFPELASCGYMFEDRKEAEPHVDGLTSLPHQGTKLVVEPTAWAEEAQGPLHGLHPYNHLAIASAFAHGIFVAVVNRTGVERGAHFPGQSSLTNPFGQLESLDDREGILVKSLDFSLLKRAKRP